MEDILKKIVAAKHVEVAELKRHTPLSELERQVGDTTLRHAFSGSLAASPTGIIAEFKRRSPSRGWIFEAARVEEVVPAYTQNSAAAISVLTDKEFFGGTMADLETARSLVDTPLLRKDFVVDEYQIFQAAAVRADAVLLIASALTVAETRRFATLAHELGLDVLLEIHHEGELGHIGEHIDVVGINNRNLSTFVTDIQVSFDLGDKISDSFLKISESGISDPATVVELRQAGFRGFLMGENFMKTGDPGSALNQFIAQLS